jgi:hypothetical protein
VAQHSQHLLTIFLQLNTPFPRKWSIRNIAESGNGLRSTHHYLGKRSATEFTWPSTIRARHRIIRVLVVVN